MASHTVCASCMHALRQTARKEIKSYLPRRTPQAQSALVAHSRRAFTTTGMRRVRMTIEDIREQSPTGTSPTSRTPVSPEEASAMQKFAQRMRAQKQMRAATEPYVAYGATEDLFRECARAGDYAIDRTDGREPVRTDKGEDLGVGSGWWYDDLHLKPTFNTWAQITFLHLHLLTVRLRLFPAEHAHHWHQNLLDHFFYAAEDRMATHHAMSARSIRNRYLKELFVQWRGVLTAYDEGLIKGDAVLATAIWRNLFDASPSADVERVALLVAWYRKSLAQLDRMSDADIASGDVRFADPQALAPIVRMESKGLKMPFSQADLQEPSTG